MLNVISQGYIMPFTATPPPFYAKNNRSSLQHGISVEGAINALVMGGLAVEVRAPPHCCNPLTVSAGKRGKTAIGT